MAIKKCKECGSDVSTKAKTCPKCGIANPGRKVVGCFTVILVMTILFLIIKSCATYESYKAPAKQNLSTPKKQAEMTNTISKEYNFDVVGGYKVNVVNNNGTYLAHFTPAIKRNDTTVKTVFGAIGQKVFNKKLSEIGKFELSPTSKPGVNGIGIFYKNGDIILFIPYKNNDGSVHSAVIETDLTK